MENGLASRSHPNAAKVADEVQAFTETLAFFCFKKKRY
jgi:hypothetical protein